MRKIIWLFIALLLFLCPALAEEEEELTLADMLSGVEQELLEEIFIPLDEESLKEADSVQSIYEEDGSTQQLYSQVKSNKS